MLLYTLTNLLISAQANTVKFSADESAMRTRSTVLYFCEDVLTVDVTCRNLALTNAVLSFTWGTLSPR